MIISKLNKPYIEWPTTSKSYVPIEKPLLTKEQRSKRFLWAKAHSNWTKQHWRKVIFSDESRDCINSKVKHPLSIQVWGAISYYGKITVKDGKWKPK